MALKVNGGDGRTSTLQEHTAVIQHEGQQRAQADKAQWHSWRWGRGGAVITGHWRPGKELIQAGNLESHSSPSAPPGPSPPPQHPALT